MTEEKEKYEIVQRPSLQLGTIAVEPQEIIEEASRIATALAGIINQRHLYSKISGKKYVHVDGWNTMGAMIGVLPREESVVKLENGYEATVALIRVNDGMEIGRGSAICTRDEKNWAKRDENAIRSMAITRATGKAFRIGFSWILKLAGFEPTPFEEMPDVIEGEVVEKQDKSEPKKQGKSMTPATKFWTHAKKLGLDTETGQSIVKECEGDFDKAFDVLKEQYTPPE